MKSIRTYLVVVILSVICLSNFIAAFHGYRDSQNAINELVDQQIFDKVESLTALINGNINVPSNIYNSKTLFQIWKNKQLLAKSSNAPDTLFDNRPNVFHVINYQGNRWRTFTLTLESSPDVSIIVASRFDLYSELTENILLKAIAPIIWVLPIVGLLVLLVINIGLKPVKELAKRLSLREANDFSELNDDISGELSPIVNALNHLFYRLSDAFERERRFSSDAAHELRTPLAALKVNLHNLSKDFGESHDFEVLKRTTERMEHCIEQLLSMHRATLDIDDSSLELCDLYKLSQQTITEMYDSISARHQSIELSGSATNFLAESSSLSVLLRNLIDNASKYSPDYGNISLHIEEKNDRIKILVEDSGPGIPESEYSRVLDRFYRIGGDQHSSNIPGSGLGLSIVSFIVQLYKGQIIFSQSSTLGGLAIEVSFPSNNKSEHNE
jgi:two-component system sensor histidine kinase QseC